MNDKGYIVFNGPYEVFFDMIEAKERMRELVHYDTTFQPVMIQVDLTENNGSEPLGVEMIVQSIQATQGSLG